MVTDYDCWHDDHDDVSVDAVIKVLGDNAEKAKALVQASVPYLSGREGSCQAGCQTALDSAIITPPHARDRDTISRLDAVAGRVLGS